MIRASSTNRSVSALLLGRNTLCSQCPFCSDRVLETFLVVRGQTPRQAHNVVVVLDKAGDINNGQPSALARWIDSMDLKPGARAYHLGCGVGYYTAIMAEVVGPRGSVVGTEVNPDLAARAKENLSGYSKRDRTCLRRRDDRSGRV